MNNLLQKAKEHSSRNPIGSSTADEIELALAWVHGEVNPTQIATAIEKPASGTYVHKFLAISLRDYILNKEKEEKK